MVILRRCALLLVLASFVSVLASGCSSAAAPEVDASSGGDVGVGVDTGTPPTDSGAPPIDAVTPAGETGQLVGMTAAHNAARDRVGASPALPHVEWSTDLAAVAQAWSEHLAATGCNLMHSDSGYGENLFWISGSSATPSEVVDSWYSEVECYTYGPFMRGDVCTSACDRSGGCGHYTQVIWRDTQRIGCGVARCGSGAEIWTCNYDPPGNYLGQPPY